MRVKLKKVLQICKQSGAFRLVHGPDGIQWLGDGGAFYPLYDNPIYDEASFSAAFDLTLKEEAKVQFEDIPAGVNLTDTDHDETPVDREKMTIHYAAMDLTALYTTSGAAFIQTRYLTPFDAQEVTLFERHFGGQTYIAVKSGFIIVGVIAPTTVYREDKFIATIRRLHAEADKGQSAYNGDNQDVIEQTELEFEDNNKN